MTLMVIYDVPLPLLIGHRGFAVANHAFGVVMIAYRDDVDFAPC